MATHFPVCGYGGGDGAKWILTIENKPISLELPEAEQSRAVLRRLPATRISSTSQHHARGSGGGGSPESTLATLNCGCVFC